MDIDPIDTPLLLHGHFVPGYWQYLLPQTVLKMAMPDERKATCMNCPKARYEEWLPDYRCCTYIPRVPNYLLGLALRHPASKKLILKLQKLGQLTPEGMHITPQQWAEYLADNAEDRFGKSEVVRCPFLERSSGLCQIYPFRNSVCSTFFCMHSHGSRGERFWSDLQTLVQQAEMALSQWVLNQLGFDLKAYIKRQDELAPTVESVAVRSQPRVWSTKAQKALWGDFYGREIELFEQAAQLIRDNRHQLWDLANQQPILEPHRFDRAARRVVPRKYRSEIEPSDFDTGENFRPAELERPLKKSYEQLWAVPGLTRDNDPMIVLSPRVAIGPNLLNDKESLDYSDLPTCVNVWDSAQSRKRAATGKADLNQKPEWREFVSAATTTKLQEFDTPQRASAWLSRHKGRRQDSAAAKFLQEWIGKGVLQTRKRQV